MWVPFTVRSLHVRFQNLNWIPDAAKQFPNNPYLWFTIISSILCAKTHLSFLSCGKECHSLPPPKNPLDQKILLRNPLFFLCHLCKNLFDSLTGASSVGVPNPEIYLLLMNVLEIFEFLTDLSCFLESVLTKAVKV